MTGVVQSVMLKIGLTCWSALCLGLSRQVGLGPRP